MILNFYRIKTMSHKLLNNETREKLALPIEIFIDISFFGVILQTLVTADPWVGDDISCRAADPWVGEDISCRASLTGDRLMVEDTSRLPELVEDIMDEFIEDIPKKVKY